MRVRKLDEDDFQSWKEKWNRLLKANLLGDNVFLTWEWLFTWWKHFGEGRKPLVLLVEDGNEVLAIAPLMLSRYRLPGFGAIKNVEFLGARHSDYNNFIILGKVAECLKPITEYLLDTVADWDWIEFKEIPETPENSDYLKKLFFNVPSGLKLKERVCNRCPYLSLPQSFDHLMKSLNKNMRQNLNKYLRRINAEHHVELKKYDEAGFSVKEAMQIFVKLHEKRWGLKGEGGAFKNNDVFRRFHMDVAERFATNKWLGLYFLMVDGEPVSVQYTFEYGQKMYYYLAGFDPQYSNYSVGNLTIMFILKRCIDKGFTEYDLMRGDEPYKMLWTNTYRRSFEVRLVRQGALSGFYNWITWNSTVNSLAGKLKLSLNRDYA